MACFVGAGLIGIWMRLLAAGWSPPGALSWFPWEHLRNAHSHLMFFSWVTPVLMALLAAPLLRAGAPARAFRWTIRAVIALGLLSVPPFLAWGYGLVALGEARMPLAAIVSSFSMFAWYAFAGLWLKHRRRLPADAARGAADLAVIGLVAGSFGAWARGALVPLKIDDPLWTHGAVHFFLTVFTFGWLVFATLAVVHRRVGTPKGPALSWASRAAAAGLPFSFILAIPAAHVSEGLRFVGGVGSLLVGIGMLVHAGAAWVAAADSRWRLPIAALHLVALGQVLYAMPWVARWANEAMLRVPYLHLVFLGFVSIALFEAMLGSEVNRRIANAFAASALVLLVTLLPTTMLWPLAWRGEGSLLLVAAGGAAPVLVVAIWLLGRGRCRHLALHDPDPCHS